MALSVRNITALAQANIIDDHVNGGGGAGKIRIYDGTPPADVDTALAGNTQLAELAMSATAFGAAADAAPGAVITANAISSDVSADATGTAAFLRILDFADVPILQMTVGTSGTDVIFNTVSFVIGGQIDITSLTVTVPE